MAATITRDVFIPGAQTDDLKITATKMLQSLVDWIKKQGAAEKRFAYLYLTASSAWGGVSYAEGELKMTNERSSDYKGLIFTGELKMRNNLAPWNADDLKYPSVFPFKELAPNPAQVKVRVGTGEIILESGIVGRVKGPSCENNLLFGFTKMAGSSADTAYLTKKLVVACMTAQKKPVIPEGPK